MKRYNWRNIFAIVLFLTLVGSIIYVIVQLIHAPVEAVGGAAYEYTKVKSDYALMLVQCALGIVVMMIPFYIEKKASIDIPDVMEILYFIFLYCAIYLGEVRDFYYVVPHWDKILHAFSGGALGALGITLVNFFHEDKHLAIRLNPFFICFFAFCFALAAGTVWEIYEFVMDGILSLNMQKFKLADGTVLSGREALSDTMMDLIVDALSALIVVVIAYPILKKRSNS